MNIEPLAIEPGRLTVRDAAAQDIEAVQTLHRRAFGGGGEAALVGDLHARDAALVSLVALRGRDIVGHVLFSPVQLEPAAPCLLAGLAPMAVAPACQRAGVGSRLVAEGLVRCRERGIAAVVVLGHSAYYPRFGFRPASAFGLSSTWDVPAEAFMALQLAPGSLRDLGDRVVRYHPAFDAL